MALVKYNNNSISAVTATGLASGSLVLIKTLTASSSGTLSFVHGTDGVILDSTYPIYKFEFINMHPSSDVANFQFNMSTDSGSNYNVTKTSTFFRAIHNESDTAALLSYQPAFDLAQGTGFQVLSEQIGFDNDQASSGTLQLFNPSSTVFVKHFIGDFNCSSETDFSMRDLSAGYGNTTSAVDAIQFKMSAGNIDSGKIKLYGIKDS